MREISEARARADRIVEEIAAECREGRIFLGTVKARAVISKHIAAALAADAKGAGPVVVKPWRAAHSATWPECFGLEHDGEFVIHPMAGLSGPIARRIAECLNEYDQQRIRSAIVDPPAVTAPEIDADGDEIISPYEWLAQEFERLAVLRKMWTPFEIAEIIRRHDIYRPDPPAALGAGSAPEGWSAALKDVADERQRQISGEGWTPEHDDAHDAGELARAAGIYALIAGAGATAYRNAREGYHLGDYLQAVMDHYWPWDRRWFKATTRRRDLVKAGALIVAELERLDRAAIPAAPGEAP
jgi:hypothetical protein